MNSDWLFVCNGMQIAKGIKALAKKNGTLGITALQELILYNDNGEIIDRAPLAQVVVKLGSFAGDSVKINDRKYFLSFIPQPKGGGMAVGMQYAQDLEKCEKRNEFKALIEKIQI